MEPAGPAGGARQRPGRSICRAMLGVNSKESAPILHPEGRRGIQECGVKAFFSMSPGWWPFCRANAAGEGGRYSPNQRRTPLLPRSAAHRPCPVLRREAAGRGTTTPGMPCAIAGPSGAAPPSLRAARLWSPRREGWR